MSLSRRQFLGCLVSSHALLQARGGERPLHQATRPRAPLESFDHEVEQFMQARGIPGGALAVVRHGRLIYARGYGLADRDRGEAVQPNSLFRIASISKPITALAVLRLVETGRLDLEASVAALLDLPALVLPGDTLDARWRKITIRQLLHHTAGWDRDKSFDPMFRPAVIARTVGVPSPPGPAAIIRYMLGQPLDFEPGTSYAYSNFGYCLLGRVIERLTRQPYARYVRGSVLAPAGIRGMRLGHSLEKDHASGEVHYYTASGKKVPNVFGSREGENSKAPLVPEPYGGFNLEAMDAHGGWLASVLDLARLSIALENPDASPLLKSNSFSVLYERPRPPVGRRPDGTPTDFYYGCGWLVRPVGAAGKANYWHNGSLPGTYALWVRRWDRLSWIAVFNQRSENTRLPDGELDPALHRAANAVTHWPEQEWFPKSPVDTPGTARHADGA